MDLLRRIFYATAIITIVFATAMAVITEGYFFLPIILVVALMIFHDDPYEVR